MWLLLKVVILLIFKMASVPGILLLLHWRLPRKQLRNHKEEEEEEVGLFSLV